MLKADQGVYRLQVPGGTEAAIRALANNPNIAFVEPNYKVTTDAIASDTYYNSGALWGMESDDSPTSYGPSGTTNAFGSGAEEAWGLGYTGSRSVVVAVIDEGIQITHPDLAANIWRNPGEVAGDGIDNDVNGYVDDVNGWDFYYDDNSVYDVGEDAHGTHVAGTIGALGNNGIGVAGVNWNVTIIPAKFLGPQGGYISDAVTALNYLTDLKTRYNINLVAVNNSWGGGGYSSAMHGAIIRAAKQDILFVAAAGNSTSNNDATASYPSNYSSLQGTATETAASYESVIAVASITSTGALSSFSSYGATTVDLGAPGSGIWSSVPTDSYASYNGTSMATPHVTGALALYSSYNTTAGASARRDAVLGNSIATASLAGRTVTGGRLSLEGLFGGSTEPPPPPPPPVVSTYDPTVVSVSAPATSRLNRNNTVFVTVGNLGNTAAQVRVALTASGGTPGNATTVLVPAGGTATATINWKAPRVRTVYTLTATTTLVSTTLVDANLGNNTGSTTITVV
ncbi:MAG: peptidase S8 [Mycobacterium sp.]|nr:peptidase S8 [Mycobacterium sp.]